jgi:hypothetical protein
MAPALSLKLVSLSLARSDSSPPELAVEEPPLPMKKMSLPILPINAHFLFAGNGSQHDAIVQV